LYLLFFTIILAFTGCSEDIYDGNLSNSQNIIHKKINLEEIRSDQEIVNNLSNYSKFMKESNLKQKLSDSLVVDISFANYLETEEFISYTFNMPTNSVTKRNFVLNNTKIAQKGLMVIS
jgi:hypothetical protein